MNIVVLHGTLSRDVERRDLSSGDHVAQLELTIRDEGVAATTVPLAWRNPPDRALSWTAGTELVVRGRVQRRFFRVGGATTSRTEVAVDLAVPARQRARSAGLIRGAADALAEAASPPIARVG